MRLLLLALLGSLVGCIEPVAARWELDHDHVIAARATPPQLAPGESAVLEALVAHRGGLTTIEAPTLATAPLAPEELQPKDRAGGRIPLVSQLDSSWIVTAPDDAHIASSRPVMGLPPDSPVPVEIVMTFAGPTSEPFYVKKTVYLGARVENPTVPPLSFDGALVDAAASLVATRDRDLYVSIAVPEGTRVNWYSSCGSLFQDDVATAFLRVLPDDPCDGELAVVMRDERGGVAWHVWPIRAENLQ